VGGTCVSGVRQGRHAEFSHGQSAWNTGLGLLEEVGVGGKGPSVHLQLAVSLDMATAMCDNFALAANRSEVKDS
jgi:hypothetical protein